MSVCFKLLSSRQGLQLRSWPSTNALLQFNKSIVLNAATLIPANSALPSILPRRCFFSSPSLSATQNDYYQRLGVSEKATAEEIKAAYFRLSKLHHPDVNQSDQASAIFLKLREAYDVLGNAQKRIEYDKSQNIHKKYKIVRDVNPPGERKVKNEQKERQRKERQRKERERQWPKDETDASADDLKRARQRYEAESEAEAAEKHRAYQAYMEARPKGLHRIFHMTKLLWMELKSWAYGHYRRKSNTFRAVVGLIMVVLITFRHLVYSLPIFDERKIDNFTSDEDSKLPQWIWSDFAWRWKWRKNLHRLPEMVEEERRAEKEQMLERYRIENANTDDEQLVLQEKYFETLASYRSP